MGKSTDVVKNMKEAMALYDKQMESNLEHMRNAGTLEDKFIAFELLINGLLHQYTISNNTLFAELTKQLAELKERVEVLENGRNSKPRRKVKRSKKKIKKKAKRSKKRRK